MAQQPTHAGALHGLGVLALRAGRPDVAIGLIGQAARLTPDHAGYHLDLGLALRERGHLEEARAAFHVAALLDPRDATPRAAMADILARLDRLAEAEAAYAEAVRLAPDRAGFRHAWALVLRALGRAAEALEQSRKAVSAAPDDTAWRREYGGLLVDAGEPAQAERELLRVLAADPDDPRTRNNLGLALQDLERPEEALAAFQAARLAAPDEPDICNNLGVALRELDRNDEALGCFDAVVSGHPDHAPAHFNAASILLMRGDYARGWTEFEWRDRVPGAVRHAFPKPRWQGDALDGRVLLVHAEMGLGDTLQFCRFVPRIAGNVVFVVQPPLVRLLGGLGAVTAAGAYDLQCPLLSLPRVLGVSDVTTGPYLHADPAAVAVWRARVAGCSGQRIGVCWAGSGGYARDRARSLSADRLAGLARALSPASTLISLQKSPPFPPDPRIIDWTADLHDLADTAALIEALDLVVSVDTAVAHLAGALGKPVLLLDRFAGDWRWMRGRTDSPWYPSVTIIRQTRPGDWDSVLAALR